MRSMFFFVSSKVKLPKTGDLPIGYFAASNFNAFSSIIFAQLLLVLCNNHYRA